MKVPGKHLFAFRECSSGAIDRPYHPYVSVRSVNLFRLSYPYPRSSGRLFMFISNESLHKTLFSGWEYPVNIWSRFANVVVEQQIVNIIPTSVCVQWIGFSRCICNLGHVAVNLCSLHKTMFSGWKYPVDICLRFESVFLACVSFVL